jgi:hypothetical protein
VLFENDRTKPSSADGNSKRKLFNFCARRSRRNHDHGSNRKNGQHQACCHEQFLGSSHRFFLSHWGRRHSAPTVRNC